MNTHDTRRSPHIGAGLLAVLALAACTGKVGGIPGQSSGSGAQGVAGSTSPVGSGGMTGTGGAGGSTGPGAGLDVVGPAVAESAARS